MKSPTHSGRHGKLQWIQTQSGPQEIVDLLNGISIAYSMPNFLIKQQWMFIALVFFGIIAYIAWVRWRDRRWIEGSFRPPDNSGDEFWSHLFWPGRRTGLTAQKQRFFAAAFRSAFLPQPD